MSDTANRRPWIAAVIVTVLVAVLITGVVMGGGGDNEGPAGESASSSTAAEPAPVAVSSDAPRYATLAELVEASDLVVRATVTETRRGRVFGEPNGSAEGGSAGIESRLVGVEVTEVLAGAEPPSAFYIEEEGWLLDGAPLIVDGLNPSVEGQEAIWFLVDPVTDPDQPSAFVAVNAQGRYVVTSEGLQGADLDDPLIARIEALSPDELAAAVGP